MTQTLAVPTAITNLNEAHQHLNLRPANSADFFSEWQGKLPELSPEEIDTFDRLKLSNSNNTENCYTTAMQPPS